MKSMKKMMTLALCLTLIMLAIPEEVYAMHIMEGFLPVKYAVMWGAICVPFVIWGFVSIKNTLAKDRKLIMLLMMAGAFTFVLSALKIPSVTGSSSHPTGTGLGAILFGPSVMAVLGIIVLLFQAILLAHGGLTTLGANTFSMAIVGPFVAFGVYMLCKKAKISKTVGVFLGAFLGDLVTYVVTAGQLAIAHPSAKDGFMATFKEFLSIFAVTQVPIAIIEGLVTVAVIKALESLASPELEQLGYLEGGR